MTSPLIDTTVSLLYQLQTADGVVTSQKNVKLTVPGRYSVEPTDNPKPDVLPSLREWKGQTGIFTLTEASRILYADVTFSSAANILHDYILAVSGKDLAVASGTAGAAGDIIFTAGEAVLGEEGYETTIADTVTAASPEICGAVYAAATIAQILSGSKNADTLPQGLIRDYPAYEVRGLMLDTARTWFDLDTLESLGKYMAYYKLNTLHLHLNESKLRVESEAVPDFTFGGAEHYAKTDYAAFGKMLASYGVTVVSEIDSPAHAAGYEGILPKLDDHRLDILDPTNRAQCETLIGSLYDEFLNDLSTKPILHIDGETFYTPGNSYSIASIGEKTLITVADNVSPVTAVSHAASGRLLAVAFDGAVTPDTLTVNENAFDDAPAVCDKDGKTTLLWSALPFSNGENAISFTALDENGKIVSGSFSVSFTDTQENLLGNVYECDSVSYFNPSGADLSVSTEEFVSGGSSLKSIPFNPYISLNKVEMHTSPGNAARRYALRLKLTDPAMKHFCLQREYWHSDGSLITVCANSFEVQPTTDWQTVTVDFNDTVQDDDFGFCGVYINCLDVTEPTVFYIDCLEMTRIGEETPFVLPDPGEGIVFTDGKTLYQGGEAVTPSQIGSKRLVLKTDPRPGYTPITADKNSIRISAPAGIRFGGFVSAAALFDADEIGFIVARGDLLADRGLTAADEVKITDNVTEKADGAFTARTAGGMTLVGARNYIKGSINKTVDVSDGKTPFGNYGEQGSYFTGVVINLDKNYTKNGVTYANRYDVPFVARAYVKIGSLYFYGNCTTKSVKEAAENIKASGGDMYTANKAYIDEIIAGAGQTVTE